MTIVELGNGGLQISDGDSTDTVFGAEFVRTIEGQFAVEDLIGANPDAGRIGLAATQVTVSEESGEVLIPVERTINTDGVAVVSFQTVAVTAEDGSDFVGTDAGQVVFADGQTTAFISVTLLDDQTIESVESFSVSLFATAGADLGVPRTAIVTIEDDEAGETLIGHWKLNESSLGESVVNEIGSGDGTHVNFEPGTGISSDAPTTDTPNPYSLQFDGENDFVTITGDDLDLSSGNYTQSVWVKPPDNDDPGFRAVIGHQDSEGVSGRYPGIWVYQSNAIHTGFGNGESWNSVTTTKALTPGEWNHVAVTFNGDELIVYVNGEEKLTTTNFAGLTPQAGNEVNIGYVDNYFEGNIDDVRIYNRALSASEVGVLIDGADLPEIPDNGIFETEVVATGLVTPGSVEFLPNGEIIVSEQIGRIRLLNPDGSVGATVLDITDIVNFSGRDRGMLGFTLHPDLQNNPYLYVSYTYDPPETADLFGAAGQDGSGARVARISRFTLNSDFTVADPDSEFVLVGNNSTFENIGTPDQRPELDSEHSCVDELGNAIVDCIPSDELSHTIGDLEFGPDGYLYASSGDGGSFGRVDPINLRSLDIDSLAGKVLKIDPITGQGLTTNPFYDGDLNSNESKIFYYGLRNPYRLAINSDGDVFAGDVGWTQWEEINVGAPGANFGWPAFEGGYDDGVSSNEPTNRYDDLQEVQDYYATNPIVTAPIWARLHSDGASAIILGDFVTNSVYGDYEGDLLFMDIGDQVLRAAQFADDGSIASVVPISNPLGFYVDITMGPDGFVYFTDLVAGTIGRFVLA